MRRFLQTTCLLLLLAPFPGCGVLGLRPYRNTGKSMEPTLHDGTRVLVSTTFYAHHPLEDGDLIVFRHNGTVLIKRLSGVPGEVIESRANVLYRDGRKQMEPYVSSSEKVPDELATFPPRKLGSDELFVTGDNRAMSLDSRSPEFGTVRRADVIGKFMGTY